MKGPERVGNRLLLRDCSCTNFVQIFISKLVQTSNRKELIIFHDELVECFLGSNFFSKCPVVD